MNSYDNVGRLLTSAINLNATTRTLTYAWNKDGARTSVTHPGGAAFTYVHDGLDRMIELKQGSTSLVTIAYDSQGRRISQSRMAGVAATSYGYDNASRLTALTDNLASTASDLSSTFAYNPASQIVIRTRNNDAFTAQTVREGSLSGHCQMLA